MPAYLNILISTIDSGIDNLKNVILDSREDVSYIISHQYTHDKYRYIPKELLRKDVVISQIEGKGVTKSRNNAIRMSDGKIGLFSDDDVTYTDQYFNNVIETFKEDDTLDAVIFKMKKPGDLPDHKNYPKAPKLLKKLPFSIGTIEIAINIDKIKEKGIFFDERFGAGQELLIGSDENIFVLDCIKKDLNVWFFPKYVVTHPYQSTIMSISKYDKRRVSVIGAYDARINGIIALPKAFWDTIKLLPDLKNYKKNPLLYLKERLFAASYILITNFKKQE